MSDGEDCGVAAVLLMLAGRRAQCKRAGEWNDPACLDPKSIILVQSGAHSIARSVGLDDNETQVASGTLDDGKDLLPKAEISIEQAIAAAKTAASGRRRRRLTWNTTRATSSSTLMLATTTLKSMPLPARCLGSGTD